MRNHKPKKVQQDPKYSLLEPKHEQTWPSGFPEVCVCDRQRPGIVHTTSLAQFEAGERRRMREQTAWLLLFCLQKTDGDT